MREALAMAFDFEWANANLFANAYQTHLRLLFGLGTLVRGQSLPMSARRPSWAMPQIPCGRNSSTGPISSRSATVRAATARCCARPWVFWREAGWTVTDKGLVNAAGEHFAFTISVQNKDQEKIALHYQRTLKAIGITADVRLVDAAQFAAIQKTYDYDMIPATWFNSLSPGNEQVLLLRLRGPQRRGHAQLSRHRRSRRRRAIKAMLDAKSREDFVAAVRAEDRLLVSGFYIVPFYDAGGQWVARWNHIGRPEAQPLPGFEATTLWRMP